MSKITWDETGKRFYETGVDHGVLYVMDNNTYGKGVAWNGLTSVSESPEGADATDFWADNIKYASMRAAENFKGTIEAYTYPDEFSACNGEAQLVKGVTMGQQARSAFGMCYRTWLGNDTTPASEKMFKLHILYGCTVSPSERSYETVNDSPDAITFSWEFETTPVPVTGHQPTAILVIDSRNVEETKMNALMDKLYGTTSEEPTLPTPDEIKTLLA